MLPDGALAGSPSSSRNTLPLPRCASALCFPLPQIKELRGQVDHYREAHATVSREMAARLAEAQGASAKLAQVGGRAAGGWPSQWLAVPGAREACQRNRRCVPGLMGSATEHAVAPGLVQEERARSSLSCTGTDASVHAPAVACTVPTGSCAAAGGGRVCGAGAAHHRNEGQGGGSHERAEQIRGGDGACWVPRPVGRGWAEWWLGTKLE